MDKLDSIVEIIEVKSISKANQLLEDGWVLLSTGFCKSEVPGYDHHSYSLGLPKHVKEAKESGMPF